jgi:hypothetical protein
MYVKYDVAGAAPLGLGTGPQRGVRDA